MKAKKQTYLNLLFERNINRFKLVTLVKLTTVLITKKNK